MSAEAEGAIAAVGEALDRIDAPQGATYAERIDRLYRELTGRPTGEDEPDEKVDTEVESDDEVLPDEFDCATEACKRLHERLAEGPIPNPAELARVIDILRHGVGR